jgi:hypothetical protein
MNYTLARLAPQTRRGGSAQAGELVARSSGWDQAGWTFRFWHPERRHSERGQSVWVFLTRGRFAAKAPTDERWIHLDFLGFSRPNRDFSMGYAAGSEETFFSALSPGVRRAGTGARGLCMRKRRIVHGASLT